MKRYFSLISLFAVACSLFFAGCAATSPSDESTSWPALKQRPHLIGPEDEMGQVTDIYNGLTAKLKANPEDHESILQLAELYMQEARISGDHGYYYPAALRMIEHVLTKNTNEAIQYRALLDHGSVLLSQHRFTDAKMAGEKALKLNAHSADAYGVLTDAHVELGMYKEAVVYADKMVSIRPVLRSYSRVSYLREIFGQMDGAIQAMEMAVAAGYPGMEQTEWARLTLGELYEKADRMEDARQVYEMSLAYRPQFPFAIGALANWYSIKGDMHKADSLNAVAMGLIPEISFYTQQAKWDKERGRKEAFDQNIAEIKTMLADDVASGHQMNLEYADVYLELLDDPKGALSYAEEEHKARPLNKDVNHMMHRIYAKMGNNAKAEEYLLSAKKVVPDTATL